MTLMESCISLNINLEACAKADANMKENTNLTIVLKNDLFFE